MNIQIETISVANGGKMNVIRDISTVKRLWAVADMAMRSIRNYPCGHKPSGVSGHCEACAALKQWDELWNPNRSGGGQ